MENKSESRSNPFAILKEVYTYWTGYDPDLLDEVVAKGEELHSENLRLNKKIEELISDASNEFWKNFGAFAGMTLVVLVISAALLFGIIASQETSYQRGIEIGIKFSEATHRDLNFDEVKVNLIEKNRDILFSKSYYNFDTTTEAGVKYVQMINKEIKEKNVYSIYEMKKQ